MVFENLPKTLALKSASDMDLHVGTHPVKGPVSFSNNVKEAVHEGSFKFNILIETDQRIRKKKFSHSRRGKLLNSFHLHCTL